MKNQTFTDLLFEQYGTALQSTLKLAKVLFAELELSRSLSKTQAELIEALEKKCELLSHTQ